MDALRPQVLVITGPTAGGKSGLAISLAKQYQGEIINADAMQCYAPLRVLTARPSVADEQAVPHHLYGFQELHDPAVTASSWALLADAAIERVLERGGLPIVCGGSGFYLHTWFHGIDPLPSVPQAVRDRCSAYADREIAHLTAPLRLKHRDRQRTQRQWEVYVQTGRELAAYYALSSQSSGVRGEGVRGEGVRGEGVRGEGVRGDSGTATDTATEDQSGHLPTNTKVARLAYDVLWIVMMPDRARIYANCEARLRTMLDSGACEEVRMLPESPANHPLQRALGVAEIRAMQKHQSAKTEALATIAKNTRNYVKRQETWIRKHTPENDCRIIWLASAQDGLEAIASGLRSTVRLANDACD
ncbi:MAG: hypothetical protein K0U36_06415 [Alphaproteobacteria bacterium]|nr:hypothetical protein [Alphaproteobacteria bacterium]